MSSPSPSPSPSLYIVRVTSHTSLQQNSSMMFNIGEFGVVFNTSVFAVYTGKSGRGFGWGV